MKGLIYKDLCNLKSIYKIVLILLAFYGILGFQSEESLQMGTGFITTFIVVLPISVFSYDEHCKWDLYATALPMKKRDMVLEKYFLGISFIAVCVLINMGMSFIFGSGKMEVMYISVVLCILALFMQIISFPIMFKFGSEKSRYASILVMLIPVILIMMFEEYLPPLDNVLKFIVEDGVVFVVGGTLILYILSLLLSIKIYENKEL